MTAMQVWQAIIVNPKYLKESKYKRTVKIKMKLTTLSFG